MINYKNPAIEVSPSAEAVDLAIQDIQNKLGELPWLEKIFGRCVPQRGLYTEDEARMYGRKDYIYPEVYNNREPMVLMVNDNLKSYCFFHAKDPLEFNDYEVADLQHQMVTQPMDIIFWGNLEKVNPALSYNFSEQLRREVLLKLKKTAFVPKKSYMSFDKVFDIFTITETFRPYLKPPYFGFRMSGELSFDYFYDNCI